jgi:hypothetical protein
MLLILAVAILGLHLLLAGLGVALTHAALLVFGIIVIALAALAATGRLP